MSDFYDLLRKYKEEKSLTYSDLGRMISVSGDTFRMAMNRKTFSDLRKEKLLAIIKGEQTEQDGLFYYKTGVKISAEEMITFLSVNIKEVNKRGLLNNLIDAINTVKNIEDYNKLNNEIEQIKELLKRNKDILK